MGLTATMRVCSVHTCWAGEGAGETIRPPGSAEAGLALPRTLSAQLPSEQHRFQPHLPANMHFGITSPPTLFSTGHSYSPAAFLWKVSLRQGRTRLDKDGRMGTSSEPHTLALRRTLARRVCVELLGACPVTSSDMHTGLHTASRCWRQHHAK